MERIRKWAVVTGAGSGIGREFALQLYDMGYSLILVSKTSDRLATVRRKLASRKGPAGRNQRVEVFSADLSTGAGCVKTESMIRAILKTGTDGTANVPAILVNSAGFGTLGDFDRSELDEQVRMIDTNVTAVVRLTYMMIHLMEKRGGRIVNVASTAGGFPGGPHMAVYYATKSFVLGFTNGVRKELEEKGSLVHVSVLCPGPVNTDFNARAGVKKPLKGMSARRCVRAAISGMKRDEAVIVPGITNRIAMASARLLPDRVILPLVSIQQKRKEKTE